MPARLILVLAVAFAVLLPSSAAAAPRMPKSVEGLTDCRVHENHAGYRVLVYVVRGSLSCDEAVGVVKQGLDVPGWTYYDWTKVDDDSFWTDVWERTDDGAVIGGVLQVNQGRPPPPVRGRKCGSLRMSAITYRVTVRRISCRRGRALIRRAKGRNGRFAGFRCRNRRGERFLEHRCTRGRRVVVARYVEGA
jgi:hypothetical protein